MNMEGGMNDDGFAWVVVESSHGRDTTVGVFTTIELAREAVASFGRERIADFSIEGHAIDRPRSEPIPWEVALSREGEVLSAEVFIGCNCGDDEAEYLKRSFIARDGESMGIIVFALTPGQAIEAADRYRHALLSSGYWRNEFTRLEPITAVTA
jgi:hypothetical protein